MTSHGIYIFYRLQEEAKQSLQDLIARRHNATLAVAYQAIQESSSLSELSATTVPPKK